MNEMSDAEKRELVRKLTGKDVPEDAQIEVVELGKLRAGDLSGLSEEEFVAIVSTGLESAWTQAEEAVSMLGSVTLALGSAPDGSGRQFLELQHDLTEACRALDRIGHTFGFIGDEQLQRRIDKLTQIQTGAAAKLALAG